MTIHSEFLEILAMATRLAGSVRNLADVTGLEPSTLTRWKAKTRIPNLESVQPIFDFLACGWQEALLRSGASIDKAPVDETVRQQTHALEAENAALREQLTLAKGEIQALERQLARLTPTPTVDSEGNSKERLDLSVELLPVNTVNKIRKTV